MRRTVEAGTLFVEDASSTANYVGRTVDVISRRLARVTDHWRSGRTRCGIPGLLAAYRLGNVVIANAIGAGVADDKSIYPYVPDMVRFYLGEEPLLRNVPTYQCRKPEDLSYVLAHLSELVVKEVHGAGGYGMLVGPTSTAEEIARFREAWWRSRRATSRSRPCPCPPALRSWRKALRRGTWTCVRSCSTGRDIPIVPGGLTRVALRKGSLVVNSSQGGGTKDTWVVDR